MPRLIEAINDSNPQLSLLALYELGDMASYARPATPFIARRIGPTRGVVLPPIIEACAMTLKNIDPQSPGAAVDLGPFDQAAPAAESFALPQRDQGIPRVYRWGLVTCQCSEDEQRNVYLLVKPLAAPNATIKHSWWVQQGICRFGDPAQPGTGYFAVVGVATSQWLGVGMELFTLPSDASYTKAIIVKCID